MYFGQIHLKNLYHIYINFKELFSRLLFYETKFKDIQKKSQLQPWFSLIFDTWATQKCRTK